MTNFSKNAGLEIVEEAKDPQISYERQKELAIHPLIVVKKALLKNPNLCDEARILLGDLVTFKRRSVFNSAKHILKD